VPLIGKVLNEQADAPYFLAGWLASLKGQQDEDIKNDRLKLIFDGILSLKPPLSTFKQANLYLAMHNLMKERKIKLGQEKSELLDENCKITLGGKTLIKHFQEIISDDKVNTLSQVPFFDLLTDNVLGRQEKYIVKLFQFFASQLDDIACEKELKQKRIFHLLVLFRILLEKLAPSALLAMNIEESLKQNSVNSEGSGTIADTFIQLFDCWLKQFSNKGEDVRAVALELDNMLANKLNAQEAETKNELTIFLLKLFKAKPLNSLRGKDMKLMNALLIQAYQSESCFNQYFSYLKGKVSNSHRISELSFYLNELEYLGQVSLSAKTAKEVSKDLEIEHRTVVLKYLIDLYVNCGTQADLELYFGSESKIEWTDQDISFKKFRTKCFERVLNLVFKREDPKFLEKASSVFSSAVLKTELTEDLETQAAHQFISSINKTIKQISKTAPESFHLTLLRSLVFANIFEDDISKTSEIVSDILTSSTLLSAASEKPSKKVKIGTP
jgi:hypothetical protein